MPDSVMAAVGAQAGVKEKCKAYLGMACKWELIDDLMGGTEAMRCRGVRWLPLEPREEPDSYTARVQRSFLYNGLKDTVHKLVAKPFSKPVTVSEDLPDQLTPLEDDADMSGADLTQFSRSVFKVGVSHGLCHVLVDYPQTLREDGSTPNLAEETQMGARPYFVLVPPQDAFGWRHDKKRLKHVRIHFVEYEADGPYGEKCVHYIRVYEQLEKDGPVTCTIHKSVDDEVTYLRGETIVLTNMDRIPIETFYTEKTGEMVADPPLEDLAWLNLCHWQSYSDQRGILRVARCGILHAAGFEPDELTTFAVGPTQLLKSVDPQATMKFVEHTGAAIDAGRADLDDLERKMEQLGMQPLVERTADSTATGKAIDEGRSHTRIEAWIRGLEKAIRGCFEVAGKWLNVDLPKEFAVDVFSDFGFDVARDSEISNLIKLRVSGDLTRITLLREVKRRGLLGDDVDVEEEAQGADEELNAQLEADRDHELDLAERGDPAQPLPGAPQDPGGERRPPVPKGGSRAGPPGKDRGAGGQPKR